MSPSRPIIAVIGGTGAQGEAVIIGLAEGYKYDLRVLTRSASTPEAVSLAKLAGVVVVEGNCYDEPTLWRTLRGVQMVYVNTNGLIIGQRNELYWGIRMYEIARNCGVEHFQYASLPYASKLGGFDPKFRCGHMDGKGRVAEYIMRQPTSPMRWTIHTTVPYMELLAESLGPRPSADDPDVWVFAAPMGKAKQPLLHLADLGRYARWIFDNPDRSSGLDLQVSTSSETWDDIAKACSKITGRKTIFQDITLDQFFAGLPNSEQLVAESFAPDDPSLLTVREKFTGVWTTFGAGNVKIDYGLLDEILPMRVKSVAEWMAVSGFTGELQPLLKSAMPRPVQL